jgi:hypothetical protein
LHIGFGFGLSGEFSLAKQTFSGDINVKYCPSTGEIAGAGRVTIIDFNLAMNTALTGSISISAGENFSITGSAAGNAFLGGNVSGWFDVTPSARRKGLDLQLKARAYADMSASASFSYKVKYRGAVLHQDSWTPGTWSVFGEDNPADTGEQTLGSWTIP